MSRLLAFPALAAAVVLGMWLESTQGAGAASTRPEAVSVGLGDTIHVRGAPVGCRVVHVPELGRRVAVDCRRAGALRGTYGTLITGNEAALVRFESNHVARMVSVARHEGSSPARCEARG